MEVVETVNNAVSVIATLFKSKAPVIIKSLVSPSTPASNLTTEPVKVTSADKVVAPV